MTLIVMDQDPSKDDEMYRLDFDLEEFK